MKCKKGHGKNEKKKEFGSPWKEPVEFKCGTLIDALPTPQRTQTWVQVENSERGRGWGTLPSSQHFEG
jgi:hypothetical protein